MNADHLSWWQNLRHGGMLLDPQRLSVLVPQLPAAMDDYQQNRLRRDIDAFHDDPSSDRRSRLISLVLERDCGFARPVGSWERGGGIGAEWTQRGLSGEAIRPRQLWRGRHGTILPVFVNSEKRVGIGRGRRAASHVLQWLRKTDLPLAILTNGQQWRLVFAGLDYEAFCEWDIDQWFASGQTSDEFEGFRALLDPRLWVPESESPPGQLLHAIQESRKGQADLSQVLGERVRQSVEILIQEHVSALGPLEESGSAPAIYRAAVRMIMRLVVILFAESRPGLLPRDHAIYHSAYSLAGLREQLERLSKHRLAASYAAYPRILALANLVRSGSSHQAMLVPAYGGELFAPGDSESPDPMKQAIHVFETACFSGELMSDLAVHEILDLLTRTRMKIRQGRSATWISAPVDFSSLDSEYIGILYEGLLDFELRRAGADDPVVFLAIGNQPALPLSALESMDDRAIRNLLDKMKDTSTSEDEAAEPEQVQDAQEPEEPSEQETDDAEQEDDEMPEEDAQAEDDARYTLQARAETWARNAVVVGKLAKKPRGRMTPEKQMQFDRAVQRKARHLVTKTVLPGASGTSCAGAAHARAPAPSTPVHNSPFRQPIEHSVRLPTIHRLMSKANPIWTHRRSNGSRNCPKRSFR